MRNINLSYKLKGLNHFFIALFLLVSPLGAYAACCAGHGGVTSCNKSTGHQMCKDGTASPSCTCTKAKSKATKTPLSTTLPAADSKSNSHGNTMTKGCCSRHGGIAQCDKARGHQICKDGTASPACACH
ncbi:hypothetical protein ACNVED_02455 [Legionella sp. D16C41]|uniref:hypothetical protein n=1 Tax=Legionella sp. D16C41 TaxID=3402688 RepID=UPI003AF66BCD